VSFTTTVALSVLTLKTRGAVSSLLQENKNKLMIEIIINDLNFSMAFFIYLK
jgi:hypothetical protein